MGDDEIQRLHRRGGPRLSRGPGAGGGDGVTMRVDAKGNQLIVVYETPETQEAA
jgi:hypothetical protein